MSFLYSIGAVSERAGGLPGGWTCFPAGTDVTMADGNKKDIEQVIVGDEVLSQDEAGNGKSSRVTELVRPASDH